VRRFDSRAVAFAGEYVEVFVVVPRVPVCLTALSKLDFGLLFRLGVAVEMRGGEEHVGSSRVGRRRKVVFPLPGDTRVVSPVLEIENVDLIERFPDSLSLWKISFLPSSREIALARIGFLENELAHVL